MFTGLVEALGVVQSLDLHPGGGGRLVVSCPFGDQLAGGESVAVNGCCLTQLPGQAPLLAADLAAQTLSRTTLGRLGPGTRVHLERALRMGDRLGGHLVQGHVDGVTTLLAVHEGAGERRHRLSLRPEDEPFVVPQGSVAVDGVSLTVAGLGPGWFEVALVPHTLAMTTFASQVPGHESHLELDLVGKYVLRAEALSGRGVLPEAVLRRLGIGGRPGA